MNYDKAKRTVENLVYLGSEKRFKDYDQRMIVFRLGDETVVQDLYKPRKCAAYLSKKSFGLDWRVRSENVSIRTFVFKYGVVHFRRSDLINKTDAQVAEEFYLNGELQSAHDDVMEQTEFELLEDAHEQ